MQQSKIDGLGRRRRGKDGLRAPQLKPSRYTRNPAQGATAGFLDRPGCASAVGPSVKTTQLRRARSGQAPTQLDTHSRHRRRKACNNMSGEIREGPPGVGSDGP